MTTSNIVVPGQLLGPINKVQAGGGTYTESSNVFSSLLGTEQTTQPARLGPAKRLNKITATKASSTNAQVDLPTISILHTAGRGANVGRAEVLPEVGNTVLCRVTRITPRQATVTILVNGDETVLEAEWQGIIRTQDVRATEKDKVKMYESFRPGDIVRAQVISIGDQASYYLATSSNELGVIMATSEAGNTMYPISWKEYKDPETGLSESRKVARPY